MGYFFESEVWWTSHVWKLFTNTLVYLHNRKNIIVPDIQVYHSQENRKKKYCTIKKYGRSDPIRCLVVMMDSTSVNGLEILVLEGAEEKALAADHRVKVLRSVRLSLRLCKILVQFVTSGLFSRQLNLFYTTHSSSVCSRSLKLFLKAKQMPRPLIFPFLPDFLV